MSRIQLFKRTYFHKYVLNIYVIITFFYSNQFCIRSEYDVRKYDVTRSSNYKRSLKEFTICLVILHFNYVFMRKSEEYKYTDEGNTKYASV